MTTPANEWHNVQQKLLYVLLALNKQYYFGFKWLDLILSKLIIAPKDFAARFKQLHTLPLQQTAKSLTNLSVATSAIGKFTI